MLVVGVCGSPHPDGSSAHALRRALAALRREAIDTSFVDLSALSIAPCRGCFGCREGGLCVQEDDMAPLLDELRGCDGVLLASPVYMGSVSGQLKVWMDRTVALRADRGYGLGGRIGGGIACGGFRNGGQELTLQAMHTFFLQQDMLAISDGPPLSHGGAALVGDARTDEVGLETVDFLARRMARALAERRD
ncbi:MAG: flavodoxin family protein [Myxococcota bacterium]|jgi:multimeric flavodoxin WrbA|nr:flavodoxin family protein [Myxococcota bacterium]